jgi:hypothetical protein
MITHVYESHVTRCIPISNCKCFHRRFLWNRETLSTFLPATRKAWHVGKAPILSIEFWYIWHGVSDNFPKTITKISILYFHFLMNYSCTASQMKHTHTHTHLILLIDRRTQDYREERHRIWINGEWHTAKTKGIQRYRNYG